MKTVTLKVTLNWDDTRGQDHPALWNWVEILDLYCHESVIVEVMPEEESNDS